MAAVTICSDFEAQQNKVCHCFPIYFHEVMGPDAMILVFWMLSLKPTFSLSSFTFIKRLFSSFSLSATMGREKVFALLFPHPVYVPHPISKWPERPLSYSLSLGYKSGPRTPVQGRFSLELACCSNSVSYSNKLHFPLILSHIWKFFSTRPQAMRVMVVVALGPWLGMGVEGPSECP